MPRYFILLLALSSSGLAAEPPDFEKQIRPLLIAKCGECHGPKVQKGELRLDARHTALRGGTNGPALTAGKSDDSELVRRIESDDPDERMPPKGPRLTADEIKLLRSWIDTGATWPEAAYDREALRDPRRDHWAWQPIREIAPPAEPAAAGEVDRFILAKLTAKGLSPAPEADRRTLIRRLSFDLHGLPPSPAAVEAFVNDQQPRAYERLIDRLLASPHYGERQAQHWLDIAHYADTHGFERDQKRENAWPYRDWVIDAFNRDLPYDQFLRDQIAGDALRPDDPAAVIATAFLAAGPWDFVGQQETPSHVLKRLARADDLDDMLTQVITATCGITINCARCHDHKLDPISQKEYYALASVFAGVRRGDRVVSTKAEQQLAERKKELDEKLREVAAALGKLRGSGRSLADIVGGGDGFGTGKIGTGIDPTNGKPLADKRMFLEGAAVNVFAKSTVRFVDGVVIPSGGDAGETQITSTGIKATGVPRTGGRAWDAIRNGPVTSQHSTKLGDIDFASAEHSLLALHANVAITFDLAELRTHGSPELLRFRAAAGYFGQTPKSGASLRVLFDGETKAERQNIGRDDGLTEIDLPIPAAVRFLTLLTTDGGNDISHDQIGFGDARLEAMTAETQPNHEAEIAALTKQREQLQAELKSLSEPQRVYGVLSQTPPPTNLLHRGDTEQPREVVPPGAIACVSGLQAQFGEAALSDGERRIALAGWITSPANPLTRRVIVNRLWQQHFGAGLVDTPSDFGLAGNPPSHPELLDWLAEDLLREGWSLKALHRRICLSAAYRQASVIAPPKTIDPRTIDASNRLLWRQNSRRLDAESLRDAVLAVTGSLNPTMHGPGFKDFDYQEEYAPVYKYITADKPELWRRSIYRFVVRTTPHQLLTTLDCPNAANLTPTRNITTTALQSLALLNNEFLLKQAEHFASRLQREATTDDARAKLAFQLALGREATAKEQRAAAALIAKHGLPTFCRFLLNANEFVYID